MAETSGRGGTLYKIVKRFYNWYDNPKIIIEYLT